MGYSAIPRNLLTSFGVFYLVRGASTHTLTRLHCRKMIGQLIEATDQDIIPYGREPDSGPRFSPSLQAGSL